MIPLDLPTDGGPLLVLGDLDGGANTTSSCAGASSPDQVYGFSTSQAAVFRASVTPTATWEPVLYLRTSCTSGDLTCASASNYGVTVGVGNTYLTPGDYYLWVDGVSGTQGEYALQASLWPPPQGDTCANPLPLAFSDGGYGLAAVSGDLGPATNTTSACAGTSSPDLVYSFSTSQLLIFSASATPGSAWEPVLYLRASCDGSNLTCAYQPNAGSPAALGNTLLGAGTWYLWVDGADGTYGAYDLAARLDPPGPGQTCAEPLPLAFAAAPDGGQAAHVTGDTAAGVNNTEGTCGGTTGHDLVYSFTTSQPLVLNASATPAGSWQPALYLRSSCASGELTCGAAGIAGLAASVGPTLLQPGSYFLWIDGISGSQGAYALDATLAPPAPGENCANPLPLAFTFGADGGFASVSGDLTGGLNDTSSANCGGLYSPDLVYSFTTSQPQALQVTVTPGSAWTPVVYLRSSCAGSDLSCSYAGVAGGGASLSQPALPAGTYYLWVDGANGSRGAFTLGASLQ